MEIEETGSTAGSKLSGYFYAGNRISPASFWFATVLGVAVIATVAFFIGSSTGSASASRLAPYSQQNPSMRRVHDEWDRKLKKIDTGSPELCREKFLQSANGDDKKAMINFKAMCDIMKTDDSEEPEPDRETQVQRKAVCTEHCAKLWEKLRSKEPIVGVFQRCAARLAKEAVESDEMKCALTPFSSKHFSYFWKILQARDVIFVLGQGLNPDGSAPPTLVERTHKVADLYKQTGFPVVASGGDDRAVGETEAFTMANQLIKLDVPMEAILYEPQSINTLENQWFGLRVVRRYMPNAEKIHLVTSDWHMPRAALLCRYAVKYFAEAGDHEYRPQHFKGMNLDDAVEEHPSESPCPDARESSDGGFVGSNKATLDRKIGAEINIIDTMINGKTKWSLGDDNYESWIWGVNGAEFTDMDGFETLKDKAKAELAVVKEKTQKRCGIFD